MHFKKYVWEVRFHDAKIVVITDSFDNAILKAKKMRIGRGLSSIVISCRRLEK